MLSRKKIHNGGRQKVDSDILSTLNSTPVWKRQLCLSYLAVKLFSKNSTYVIMIPKRHGQTDRQTDRHMQYDNRALRSIGGKN